jgi:arylsulfatase A-like enzyme
VDFAKPIANGPLTVGFDWFYGIAASLDMPPYVYIENDRAVAVPTVPGKGFGRQGLAMEGLKPVDVLPELTKQAVQYVDRRAKDGPGKPFFLYLALTAPHTPIAPADFVKGKSKAGNYGDFVAQVDFTVGEVMKALDRGRLADNTLVIVTSDNGSTKTRQEMARFEHLPNYHFRGRKSDVWDGGHRIPFIARWPGRVPAGGTCDQTVCLTDLLATAADIVGATLPADAGEDSYSILPAMRGEKLGGPIREATVHHSIDGMFAIRQGRWKMVLGQGSGGWSSKGVKPLPTDPPGQLYDMQADVSETRNVWNDNPQVVAQLTALLEKYKKAGRSRA